MSPVLSLRAVSKSFATVLAVDGVSLDVAQGEVFGLLGPNGAGKTTLLRLILGIYVPDHGAVEVFGHGLTRADLDFVGYLPEERGLYRRQKVISVLTYLGQLKGLRRREAVAAADGWLRHLDMDGARGARVETLSKGNQQKVQIAGTLVGAPRLLIWDEPFSGLDPRNVVRVRELVARCRGAGISIVLSTHMMDQAEAVCDRVALLSRGRVVLSGTVGGLRTASGQAEVEIETDAPLQAGEDWPELAAVDSCTAVTGSGLRCFALRLAQDATLEDLLRRLLGRGARIASCRPRRPSLEEVFLRAVS